MNNDPNKKYWRSLTASEKKKLAAACGTNTNYMAQVAGGFKNASPDLANKIHAYTNGEWHREHLCHLFIDPLLGLQNIGDSKEGIHEKSKREENRDGHGSVHSQAVQATADPKKQDEYPYCRICERCSTAVSTQPRVGQAVPSFNEKTDSSLELAE